MITGAAGDIGSATAAAFAREGASLALVDLPHTQHRLEEQCRQLEAGGAHKAIVIAADMTQESQVQSMVAGTVKSLGEWLIVGCIYNIS